MFYSRIGRKIMSKFYTLIAFALLCFDFVPQGSAMASELPRVAQADQSATAPEQSKKPNGAQTNKLKKDQQTLGGANAKNTAGRRIGNEPGKTGIHDFPTPNQADRGGY
jgi:hypothetical protein